MKRKILACVVACATLFLGMGYAFWTNSLQLDTTANTGKLEVKFVDLDAYGTFGDEQGKWAVFTGIPGNNHVHAEDVFKEGSYNELATQGQMTAFFDSIDSFTKTTFAAVQANGVALTEPPQLDDVYRAGAIASDKISVNFTNMYPGYGQLFRTDILNTGTLAAKLAGMSIKADGTNPIMKSMIGVSLSVAYETGPAIRVLETNAPGATFTLGDQTFVRLSALTDTMIRDMTNKADYLYIYPDANNTMDAIFGVAMDPDWGGAYTTGRVGLSPASTKLDADSQGKNGSFTIKFNWDQFNTQQDQFPTPGTAQ